MRDLSYLKGLVLEDHFRLIRQVGRGAMAYVFEAEDLRTERRVAVKILRETYGGDEDHMRRFLREASTIARLDHVNLVRVYSIGFTPDGLPYLVMEFIDGKTLAEHLHAGGLPTMETTVAILKQLCDGLTHAHAQSVVHRDLKPSNIIITTGSGGEMLVKIVDFGIAGLLRDTPGSMTISGRMMGTPAYMSPEQCRGEVPDERADVYALGCISFEMLTGSQLIDADSAYDAMLKHVHGAVPSIQARNPKCPTPVQTVVENALEKSLDMRYASAAEFKKEFLKAYAGYIVKPRRQVAAPVVSPPAWQQHKPAIAAALVLLCVVGVVISVISLLREEPLTAAARKSGVADTRVQDQITRGFVKSALGPWGEVSPPEDLPPELRQEFEALYAVAMVSESDALASKPGPAQVAAWRRALVASDSQIRAINDIARASMLDAKVRLDQVRVLSQLVGCDPQRAPAYAQQAVRELHSIHAIFAQRDYVISSALGTPVYGEVQYGKALIERAIANCPEFSPVERQANLFNSRIDFEGARIQYALAKAQGLPVGFPDPTADAAAVDKALQSLPESLRHKNRDQYQPSQVMPDHAI